MCEKTNYRYAATSTKGFVRQLACNYLPHGYWFYVTGEVKPGKDPQVVDRTLMKKYGIAVSRQTRWRRKQRGLANVHYLRYQRFWILLATKGEHLFFEEHVNRDNKQKIIQRFFRDVRADPILFAGYSITVKPGQYRPYRCKQHPGGPPEADDKLRVRVQIAQKKYRLLTAEFLELAKRGRFSAEVLESLVYRLPYEPYAPVRQQLLNLVRRMNQQRRRNGHKDLLNARTALRYEIEAISPFDPLATASLSNRALT